MKISVAMAVYNGEKYIREQLDSILPQLKSDDQVVISVDPSTDGVERIIDEYVAADSRVIKLKGEGKGLIRNFENAISHCDGDIIFMSDQDDMWCEDKVAKCVNCFDSDKVMVVLHDAAVCTGNLEETIYSSFFDYKRCKKGIVNNILKNSYMGCCMAFRKDLLKWVMPFPKKIPMHDQWIGIMAQIHGDTYFLKETLLKYRRHGENMSKMSHSGIGKMLVWRLQLVFNLIVRNVIVKI